MDWKDDPDANAAFDSAIRFSSLSNAVVLLLLTVWLFLSWSCQSPSEFQRLGSLGVAFSVVGFVLSKTAFDKFEEYFRLRDHYQMRERISYLFNAVYPDEKPLEIIHEGASKEFIFFQMERPLYMPLKSTALHSRYLLVFEVIWIVTATLQWGYGDSVFNWFSGNGWSV